MLLEKS